MIGGKIPGGFDSSLTKSYLSKTWGPGPEVVVLTVYGGWCVCGVCDCGRVCVVVYVLFWRAADFVLPVGEVFVGLVHSGVATDSLFG
jgi:hypothetical protein